MGTYGLIDILHETGNQKEEQFGTFDCGFKLGSLQLYR